MLWSSCASVRRSRLSIFSLALVALLAALSPALALAKSGPKPRQRGTYDVTISGYYRGTGFANASPSTVAISAAAGRSVVVQVMFGFAFATSIDNKPVAPPTSVSVL